MLLVSFPPTPQSTHFTLWSGGRQALPLAMEVATGGGHLGSSISLSAILVPKLSFSGSESGPSASGDLTLTPLTLSDLGQVPCSFWAPLPHPQNTKTGLNSLPAPLWVMLISRWGLRPGSAASAWCWESLGDCCPLGREVGRG